MMRVEKAFSGVKMPFETGGWPNVRARRARWSVICRVMDGESISDLLERCEGEVELVAEDWR